MALGEEVRGRAPIRGWVHVETRLIVALPPHRVAGALLGIVALTGAGGFVYAALGAPSFADLDREGVAPAFVAGGILLLAGAGAALLSTASRRTLGWRGVSALFVVMAFDEMLGLHERLETFTGIDWQRLYAPVFLVGGIAWLACLRDLGRTRAGALFAGGGLAWAVSQVLEFFQWSPSNEPVRLYGPMMMTEEILEILGSSLFVLGTFVALRMWSSSRTIPH